MAIGGILEQVDFELLSFIILGILSLICGGVLATRRAPVSAAMMLICLFICMAGMYGLLDAHFAAVSQILVYAGAIMVVFLFVIMLLNLPPEELRFGRLTVFEILIAVVSVSGSVALGTQVLRSRIADAFMVSNLAKELAFPESDNVKNVAISMFTEFLWPFELISFVVLVATVGSVVISKRRKSDVHPT